MISAQTVVLTTFFLTILAIGAAPQSEQGQVGLIDFYGYKGLGLDAVRVALPIREGDPFPGTRPTEEWKGTIRRSLLGAIGREPTDVSVICCDGKLRYLIYIGLPGATSKPVRYNPAPRGNARFPAEVVQIYEAKNTALIAAVTSGTVREDDSQGFPLADDPALRASQVAIREYALKNESVVFRVLESASDREQRAIAADALGYARASSRQVAGLVRASLDPEEQVRNNAVRALGVLLSAKPKFAREVPASSFLQLLVSPTWTDRNKGAALFEVLTRRRDPELLRLLRATALDNLLEMARWRNVGHAGFARLVIGRIAGIEEDRLRGLAKGDQVETIINALSMER